MIQGSDDSNACTHLELDVHERLGGKVCRLSITDGYECLEVEENIVINRALLSILTGGGIVV